jgi:predicted RNA-binding protein
MSREEMQVVMRRFSRMHSYFLCLMSSDPQNAKHHRILVDYYQRQYSAVVNSIKELDQKVIKHRLVPAT